MRVRPALLGSIIVCFVLASPGSAFAVKYMSLGQAVKSYLPKGAKVFKVTKKLKASDKKRLLTDYGWKATESKYTFYVGKDGSGTPLAYVFVVPEIFNTCFHKYAVGMKPDGEVIETAIVELSCPRAFPINRKSFLKQFRGKGHSDPLTTKLDIDGVTGATLSAEATATATRKAVSLHNIFFGGGKTVRVAGDVRAARAKGNAQIQKAIDTGETLAKQGKAGAAQLPPE